MKHGGFRRRRFLGVLASAPVAALSRPELLSAASDQLLIDPKAPLTDWKNRNPRADATWTAAVADGEAAIQVQTRQAFAILSKDISIKPSARPIFSWRWRVDEMPASADLTRLDSDDLGAGVAFVFGPYGLLRKVPPTLIYTWAGSANPTDGIVNCRRHPESMRFVVVRSGEQETGRWVAESRNLREDYRAAFGAEIPDQIHAVGLWSDSDQTRGSTKAAFGMATLHD